MNLIIQPAQVQELFRQIAPRYDRANRILSCGIDRWWRIQLVKAVTEQAPLQVLDLATGTGDIALALSQRMGSFARIKGLDFCPEMLKYAQKKSALLPPYLRPQWIQGDCMALPVEDHSMDALTLAFGMRNMPDRMQLFREMHRILKKPSGRAFVLEFSKPKNWLNWIYQPYLGYLLPFLGACVTGKAAAYHYLKQSIREFPTPETIGRQAQRAGLQCLSRRGLTGGIVTLYQFGPL